MTYLQLINFNFRLSQVASTAAKKGAKKVANFIVLFPFKSIVELNLKKIKDFKYWSTNKLVNQLNFTNITNYYF